MRSTNRKKAILKQLRALVPMANMADFQAMETVATAGHLRHLPPSIAAWQAVTTRARHAHTEYDALLEEGYEPDAARFFVVQDMKDVLDQWGCTKALETDEPDYS